jgi:hypothetical protein
MSGTMSAAPSPQSWAGVTGTGLGTALTSLLLAQDIIPGTAPSYELCKTIWLYHPLGQKMAESPLNWAQSQEREIVVSGHPDRVKQAFLREWKAIKADKIIKNTQAQARVYGIASVVLGIEDYDSNKPMPYEKLAEAPLYFNVLDPLNTSGSLVLDQDTNSSDFQKTTAIATQGKTYHRSRVCIAMHEQPVYIAYTSSAFGFVGRSVYQRALYPLKSFVQTMRTDDMISRKAGLLIAKMQAPGSIISKVMTAVQGFKRSLLQEAETDNVLSIGTDEEITSLNLQNIDGAGGFARGNILKNIATAADMPAIMLENETLTEGFGEGTEDNKNIARYIDRVREDMEPLYEFFTTIVQYRAWNEAFFVEMQKAYPKVYGGMTYAKAFTQWQNAFQSKWPSLLQEPDSEKVKTDDVKLRAIVAVLEVLLPNLDPENKARVIEWAMDNINETDMLFDAILQLDIEAIRDYVPPQPGMPGEEGGEPGGAPEPKMPSFGMKAAA